MHETWAFDWTARTSGGSRQLSLTEGYRSSFSFTFPSPMAFSTSSTSYWPEEGMPLPSTELPQDSDLDLMSSFSFLVLSWWLTSQSPSTMWGNSRKHTAGSPTNTSTWVKSFQSIKPLYYRGLSRHLAEANKFSWKLPLKCLLEWTRLPFEYRIQ